MRLKGSSQRGSSKSFTLANHILPGGRFDIERLKAEDLKAGEVKSSWLPDVGHYSVPSEQWKPFVPQMMAGLLLATSIGALSVSDEWNQLLPEYKFTPAKEFLSEAWHGRA